MEDRWLEVARLAAGLSRVVESISYSIPPLDELEFEIGQARWYLDKIEAQIRTNRRSERKGLLRLVFGSTLAKLEKE